MACASSNRDSSSERCRERRVPCDGEGKTGGGPHSVGGAIVNGAVGGGPAGPHSAGGAVVSGAVGGDTAAEI